MTDPPKLTVSPAQVLGVMVHIGRLRHYLDVTNANEVHHSNLKAVTDFVLAIGHTVEKQSGHDANPSSN